MNKPNLLLVAPVSSRSGYGNHSVDIANALIDMDRFNINIIDIRWGGTPRNALKIDNPNHIPIISRLVKGNKINAQPDILIHLTVPNEYGTVIPAKFSIGITAGIETTVCAPEWLEGMNRVNLNIVPSNHSKDVFTKSVWTQRDQQNKPIKQLRLEKPIEVLFEGADLNVYHRMNVDDEYPMMIVEEMKKIKTSFNFLFVGHWLKGDLGQDRKDVGMLIKVFLETFRNKKQQPGLILKTSGAGFSVIDREEIKKKIELIKSSISGNLPPIYFLHGELTDEEMNALYNHPKVKAHISFTKGEGFGRPLLEASLSGKPVIASAWSGHVDFLSNDLSILLNGQLTNVHRSAAWDKMILEESKWFTVNYNHASTMMNEVYKNYKKYEIKAKKLSEINKKFNRHNMKKKFEEILDKHLPVFPKQVNVNLPNLPQLEKKSNNSTVTLPKLKKVNVEESNVNVQNNTEQKSNIIKLPKLNKK